MEERIEYVMEVAIKPRMSCQGGIAMLYFSMSFDFLYFLYYISCVISQMNKENEMETSKGGDYK